MSIPAMVGTIERRLLINYRVDPDVLAQVVPEPFRPHLVNGVGLAGICLIRLGHLRPSGFPSWAGVTSENAAHRVAVKWDGPHGPEYGVYIPRRDTSSHLSALVGGRLFPGEHHRSHFSVTGGAAITPWPSKVSTASPASSSPPTKLSTSAVARCSARSPKRRPSSKRHRWGTQRPATRARTTASTYAAHVGGSSRSPSTRCVPASSKTPHCSRPGRSSSTPLSSCVTSRQPGALEGRWRVTWLVTTIRDPSGRAPGATVAYGLKANRVRHRGQPTTFSRLR